MNTGDYCPRGRELYAEYLAYTNTYREYQRIHMMMAMIHAKREFERHVD